MQVGFHSAGTSPTTVAPSSPRMSIGTVALVADGGSHKFAKLFTRRDSRPSSCCVPNARTFIAYLQGMYRIGGAAGPHSAHRVYRHARPSPTSLRSCTPSRTTAWRGINRLGPCEDGAEQHLPAKRMWSGGISWSILDPRSRYVIVRSGPGSGGMHSWWRSRVRGIYLCRVAMWTFIAREISIPPY